MPAAASRAPSWCLRAREHFERGKINFAGGQCDIGHEGFLLAFDLSWEDPMKRMVGVELPLWRLGVAPEIGGRFARGTAGKRINDLYFAFGVHFYVFCGDSASLEKNKAQ